MSRPRRRATIARGNVLLVTITPDPPDAQVRAGDTPDPAEVIDAATQLAAAGHAVVAAGPDGTVLAWNPAAVRLYGWAVTEALGRPVTELYLADVATRVLADMRRTAATQPWTGALQARRRDGTSIPVLATSSPLMRDGRSTGTVTVSVNIGAAAQMLLDRSTDAALLVGVNGTIDYASAAITEVLGWDSDTLPGTDVSDLLHPDDADALAAFLHDAATVPGAHPPVLLRLRGPDTWVPVEAAVTNMLDDPTVRGVVCTIRRNPHRDALELAERTAAQLHTALMSRVSIEQAKGFLVAQQGLTLDDAFAVLRQHARNHHVRLHDVARAVVQGTLTLP